MKNIYILGFVGALIFLVPLEGKNLQTESLKLAPWGKDRKLARPFNQQTAAKKSGSFLESAGSSLIWFHKNVISPADGPRSHHKPNSSQYTLDAIKKYGFLHGVLMGCDRLMRENSDPWIYPTVEDEEGISFKWDPVK